MQVSGRSAAFHCVAWLFEAADRNTRLCGCDVIWTAPKMESESQLEEEPNTRKNGVSSKGSSNPLWHCVFNLIFWLCLVVRMLTTRHVSWKKTLFGSANLMWDIHIHVKKWSFNLLLLYCSIILHSYTYKYHKECMCVHYLKCVQMIEWQHLPHLPLLDRTHWIW